MRITAVVVGLAVFSLPAPALADWHVVGRGVPAASQPMVNDSRIVWSTGSVVASRRIKANGSLAATDRSSTGWTFLSRDPVLVGTAMVAAGVRGTVDAANYWPGQAFWSKGGTPVALTGSQFAYGSQGQDAISVSGALVYVYTDGGGQIRVQPQGQPYVGLTTDTVYDPAIASAARTWVAWRSAGVQRGIQVAEVTGLPAAGQFQTARTAPGSGYAQVGRRVALAAKGGRAWLAYPTAARMIRIWRSGTNQMVDVRTQKTASDVDLTFAPDGRAWISYIDGSSVCVRRSDPAVKQLSQPSCRALPGSAGTSVSADKAADVVTVADGKVRYARLLPALTVTVKRARGTVRVLDAGNPVRRAKVRVDGHTAKTSRRGVAAVGTWPKGLVITVTAAGFRKAIVG